MKRPELVQHAARWLYHGLRLAPRLTRLARARRRKRKAPPPRPASPYRRFYTRDRRVEDIAPRRR